MIYAMSSPSGAEDTGREVEVGVSVDGMLVGVERIGVRLGTVVAVAVIAG